MPRTGGHGGGRMSELPSFLYLSPSKPQRTFASKRLRPGAGRGAHQTLTRR